MLHLYIGLNPIAPFITCSIGHGEGVHGSTRGLFQWSERLVEAPSSDVVSPRKWGSAISLESMQTGTPLVRESLILARHLIEAHLGTELVGSELILAVVDPVFIKRVAPQGSHRGPLGIALLLPPGIRPFAWVGRTLGRCMGVCVGIVSLPGITLTQQMYGCRGWGGIPLGALI